MPVSEIERGQKGQCLTVFEGEEIEPFEFVVKGVMRGYLGPHRDLILVRLLGDKPEHTGVVAGMSGSPCSIDGKLIGALGYAFASFAKEPIAGVTPIGDMLAVMNLPEEKRPYRIADKNDEAGWKAFASGDVQPSSAQDGLVPIAAPLSMGGMPVSVREHFSPWFRELGFEPVGGGSAGNEPPTYELAPGSPITAILVRGDVDIAATGTVTTVDGEEITAFGHPFMAGGAISIPMAGASIINTMVSQLRSFKMSAAGSVIGELTQDRLPAIGGYVGRAAKMLPVSGTIKTPAGQDSFRFEVARDPGLSPRLIAVGLASVLGARIDAGHRGMLRVKATVKGEGLEPIPVSRVFSGEKNPQMATMAAVDVARMLAILWRTPFGPPPGIEIELEAEMTAEPIEEWVDSIHLGRAVANTGDTVSIAVRLLRDGGKYHTETFQLEIPQSWAGRSLAIFAAGSGDANGLATMAKGYPNPKNMKEIARWLTGLRDAGSLYLLVVADGVGLQAEVDTLSFIPGTAVVQLSGVPTRVPQRTGLKFEEARKRPGVVMGVEGALLKVRED
jgi:hypothetical protein